MGRMLETLKQATLRRDPPARVTRVAKDTPALQAVWPEDAVQEADMPFVEVGGPRTAPLPVPATTPPMVSPSPTAEGPRLMTVLYRPLPIELPTRQPRSRFAVELVAYHQPDHAISGQYRELAGRVLGALPAEQPGVLLFTSAAPATGTTTVLLNTAITVARPNGRRVVVVDAHLRRAAVAARLG